MTNEEIRAQAFAYARQNKVSIARKLTDTTIYAPDIAPVSFFMAGSPGAGKTEFSKILIRVLEKDKERRVVRIDPDEVRSRMPGYVGNNSYLFQGAISVVVEKMHDLVLHNRQSFVLDSTFSQYEKAAANLRRSLDKTRAIFIAYIYQRPEVAWRFTQAREAIEGRNIPKEAFIEQFLGARETVSRIAREFGEKVGVFVVMKDFERNIVENIVTLNPGEDIDDYIAERYTKEQLEKIL